MIVKSGDMIKTNDGLIGMVISVLTNTVVADISYTPKLKNIEAEYTKQVFHRNEFKPIKE